jgi:ABC-type sugar transport system permease subunit
MTLPFDIPVLATERLVLREPREADLDAMRAFFLGARAQFMAVTIYEQTLELLDWPFAAAIAALLLGISLLVALAYGRLIGNPDRQDQRP